MGSYLGKRSLTVDIGTPEGAQLLREMAPQCDVLIDNHKVGSLKPCGPDYGSIRAIQPDVIHCSVTGFSQEGPYASRPAYDSVLQAMGGLMSTRGQPDGEAGAGPMHAAVPITDIFAGLYAAISILASILHQRQTGDGQFIDIATIDATTAINRHLALCELMTGQALQRQGNNGRFTNMLSALGIEPAITQGPRLVTNITRIAHRAARHDLLAAVTAQQPVASMCRPCAARCVFRRRR